MTADAGSGDKVGNAGLAVGCAFLAVAMFAPPPQGLSESGWVVAGVTLLMASWWMTQAIPLAATALAPLVLFPLLGISTFQAAAAPFADPVIFLFLGGFIIAAAVQRWGVHERMGLRLLGVTGSSPKGLVAGFLLATAAMSMWVSNSATAMMMLPVAASVVLLIAGKGDSDEERKLGVALMLAVAYGASIGGVATLVGTPPNALLAAYMAREHGVQIGFAQWMALGLPIAGALLLAAWFVLTGFYASGAADPGAADTIAARRSALGPQTPAERRVLIVFVLTATAWVTRPLYGALLPQLDDSVIAMTAALALFMLPSNVLGQTRLLTWRDVAAIPWDVLLLFGGGLSLAAAIGSTGLAAWLAGNLHALGALHPIIIIAAATLAMVFFTEIASNTAAAAAFLPLAGAVAAATGLDPILLAAPLALAASCGFMLPVATPPNAIVFASGAVTVRQMMKAGLWLNVIGAGIIVAAAYLLAGRLFPP